MAFLNLNRQFPSVAAFATYLASLPGPRWGVIGSTYHNTYAPNKAQWRGHASMTSMQATYVAKGWPTGPHAYLATGTAADGIWLMCPPTQPGVHGVSCNATHFGLEVVGDFHRSPMPPADLDLLVAVAAALHRWAGIGPTLNAHRDCIARTCPGDAAYAQRHELQRRLAAALAAPSAFVLGPHGEKFACDPDIAAFYAANHGLWNFGYALEPQRAWRDGSLLRQILRCERTIISREPDTGLVRPLLTTDQLRILR